MLHFGLNQLSYSIRFDNSCYYPFSFSEERRNTKHLCGASFGYNFKSDSISIARRPSESQLEKIDLFAHIYNGGKFNEDYVGSIDTNKFYLILMKFEDDNNNYRIKIYDERTGEKKYHHMSYFRYPLFKWGYTKERLYGQGSNIILERQ